MIQKHKNQQVALTVLRNSDTLVIPVKVPAEGLIGIYPPQDLSRYFKLHEKKYNLAEAIPAGVVRGYNGIGNYLKQLKLIFSPEVKAYCKEAEALALEIADMPIEQVKKEVKFNPGSGAESQIGRAIDKRYEKEVAVKKAADEKTVNVSVIREY